MNPPPRLVPDAPLPPYRFVPGRFPHPESDPAGHNYGRPRAPVPPLDPKNWQDCRPYLLGLDLFNAGYFWEAHAEWEALWLAAGRKGPVADFLKGLIHLAAAGVKSRAGRPDGVRSHARRAAERWRGLDTERFCGLSLDDLTRVAEAVDRDGWPEESPLLLPAGS